MRHLTILLLAFCTITASAAPSTPELAELFMPAEIERPKLSPDGRFLAFLARTGDTYTIGLCNLATGQTDLSKSDAKIRPIDFWWKTPSRLLVQVSNVKLNELSYAIFDLDRKVTEDAWQLERQPGRIFDAQPNDPKHVLMLNVGEIARVNLDNGKAETIDRSPAWASTWVLDSESRARALYRSNFRFGTADFWWRPKPEANGASRSLPPRTAGSSRRRSTPTVFIFGVGSLKPARRPPFRASTRSPASARSNISCRICRPRTC